jgi:Protein of unknown function (DUF4038)/Putative collagen-binding domain of a collagenase
MPTNVQIHCPNDPTFPTTVSGNGRYLIDGNANPWMMVGDTSFGLIGNLGSTWQSDLDLYFNTRAAQGFNTVYCNYIFGSYDSNPRSDWSTLDGVVPFLNSSGGLGTGPIDYDITKPNPTYLARLDYAVNKAAQVGILLLINPADASVVGSPESVFVAGAGVTNCAAYGNLLGTRYASKSNVGWQFGNDWGFGDPTWGMNDLLGAIAAAIRAVAPNQLQSVELNFNTSTSYDNTAWGPGRTYKMDLNAVYDYSVIYDHVFKAWQGRNSPGSAWVSNNAGALTGYPTTPVYFVEGVYERAVFDVLGQNRPIPASTVRKVWFYPLCTGAIGGLYGNGLVFPMDAVTSPGWKVALSDPGAAQLCMGAAAFKAGPWWRLIPDGNVASFVTAQSAGVYVNNATTGLTSATWAAGAVTAAGDFGVVFMPTNQTITVDMSKMRGPALCRWFDPTAGTYTAIGTIANTGTHNFLPAATNAGGDPDWLLVLTA